MGKPKKTKKALSPYNRHVQREMKAGRSMKQAAASWSKSAGKPKAASRSSPKRSSPKPKGGKSRMGKKNGFNTQKIFKYVRIGALALPAVTTLTSGQQPATMANQLKKDYFGVDANGQFNVAYLAKGWMPFIAASAITYGIPKAMGILRGL